MVPLDCNHHLNLPRRTTVRPNSPHNAGASWFKPRSDVKEPAGLKRKLSARRLKDSILAIPLPLSGLARRVYDFLGDAVAERSASWSRYSSTLNYPFRTSNTPSDCVEGIVMVNHLGDPDIYKKVRGCTKIVNLRELRSQSFLQRPHSSCVFLLLHLC